MAAGYICTCSELITKLQRTSYAKAQWEDTIILGHYYWRLWQDAEPLICHCTGTVPPENEDVCWGEQSRLQTQPTVTVWPLEQQHPRGHTDTTPPAQGETEAGSPSVPECSPAPEPHSTTKHLLQQSWDPAQGGTCPQQEASAYNSWICFGFMVIIGIKSDQLPSKMMKHCCICLIVFTFPFYSFVSKKLFSGKRSV